MHSTLRQRLFDPQAALAIERSGRLEEILFWKDAAHPELAAEPEARLRALIADAKAFLPPRQGSYQPSWRRPEAQMRRGFLDRLLDPYGWQHDGFERWLNVIFDELQAPYDGPPFSTSLRLMAIIEAARQPMSARSA